MMLTGKLKDKGRGEDKVEFFSLGLTQPRKDEKKETKGTFGREK